MKNKPIGMEQVLAVIDPQIEAIVPYSTLPPPTFISTLEGGEGQTSLLEYIMEKLLVKGFHFTTRESFYEVSISPMNYDEIAAFLKDNNPYANEIHSLIGIHIGSWRDLVENPSSIDLFQFFKKLSKTSVLVFFVGKGGVNGFKYKSTLTQRFSELNAVMLPEVHYSSKDIAEIVVTYAKRHGFTISDLCTTKTVQLIVEKRKIHKPAIAIQELFLKTVRKHPVFHNENPVFSSDQLAKLHPDLFRDVEIKVVK